MEKYYDVHNHLFNKNFLAKELLSRMIKELKKLLRKQPGKKLWHIKQYYLLFFYQFTNSHELSYTHAKRVRVYIRVNL